MMLFGPFVRYHTLIIIVTCPPCSGPIAAEDYATQLAELSPGMDLADVPSVTGPPSMGTVFWGTLACVFLCLVFGCICTVLKAVRG